MDRIKFTESRNNEPRTWNFLRLPDRWSATVVCPNCGQLGSLEDHEIKDSGDVEPSVICSMDTCGFHHFITLIGWHIPERRQ